MQLNKFLYTTMLVFVSCCSLAQNIRAKSIGEIIAAEKAFAKMAADKGIQEAFVFYAAEEAIIKRGNDSLITGKAGIGNFYAKPVFKKAILSWVPDFIDASESGDMGYTIGKYTWQLKDDAGRVSEESTGIFHTVWKKQKDGEWRFVWD